MKKKWTIATVLLLAVALLAVGTWAYFSAVGTADNVITMGSVKLALHDEDGAGQPFTTVSAMPGSVVNKVVYVENVGSGAFYTRVKITPEMVGADGEIIPLDASERLLTLDLNDTDWIAGEGGYYYYRGSVDPKTATSKLFNHVTFSKDMGNEYQNATVHIYVTAEAVQTANLEKYAANDVRDVWKHVGTVEAYTTGTVTTTTSIAPCDIVLVLDQSGSMAYNFDGNETSTDSARRQYAMKQAVNTFIEAVADKYNAEKSDHRIAVVTFGTNASTLMDWTLVTPAETDTAESPSGETALKAKINGLPSEPEGATNVADGMRSAQALMQGDSGYTGTNTKRQKVVILFTDGVPTKQSDFDTTVANGAIQSAKALKDAGATVYSVGIFNGANPEQLYGDSGFKYNSNGQVGSYWASFSWWGIGDVKNYDIPAGNRFLNYISGNFPDATEIGIQRYDSSFIGIGNYGWQITRNFAREQSNYYLTANDSASLSKIFTTISENIGSANIDLGSETVIKDIVTPYFTVPQNAGAIRLSTAAYNGSAFGAPVAADPSVTAAIDPATRAVNVTGFDFNQNYVSTNAKADGTFGKKLIIEFDVSVRDGFLGGNQVPTNDGQSGIYAKGTMIKAFDVPTQDVEVKSITPTADDKAIYLGDSANLQELVHQNATFDGTNNAFVDVTYTVKDENGTVVGTYTVPAGSSSGTWVWSDPASNGTVAPEQTTTYKVTCTVSPTQTGTYESVSKDTTFTITVNTCSLTITKTVTGGGDPNQTFVFNVMKGNDLVTTVVLKAGASTTITGLAVGDYTVVEDTAWSWSYTADNVSTAVTLSSTNPNDEAKITNTYVKHDWLTSIVDVINKWTANDGKTTINNSDRVPGAN